MGATLRFVDETHLVRQAADKAGYKNLGHAIARVRKRAQVSIKNRPKVSGSKKKTKRDKKGRFLKGSGKRKRSRSVASPAGTPPFTGRGLIRRAIKFAHDKDSAIAGTQYSMIGTAGKPHEEGGPYKGETFEARSFMGPARSAEEAGFANSFTGSIGR